MALAGGAALIVRGVVDRRTRDLDFFATTPEEVNRVLPPLEALLIEEGLNVQRVQIADGFARLVVSSESDTTTIDLAWTHAAFLLSRRKPAQFSPRRSSPRTSSLLCSAVLLHATSSTWPPSSPIRAPTSLRTSRPKGPRLQPVRLSRHARNFRPPPRADFEIDDTEYDDLRTLTKDLRQQLQLEINAGLGREPDRGTPSGRDSSQHKDSSPGLEL